ncbi:MAG: FecCD family ABC transporter permease [Flavobacteriales bacterium]
MKSTKIYLLVLMTLTVVLGILHLFVLQQVQNISSSVLFWEFQVPRLLSAILAGAGLSLSGLLMQNIFQNPMAGPYVLGINSGASLLIALVILGGGPVLLSQMSLVSAAMLGAFMAAGMMFYVSTKVSSLQSLLVIGLMFASFTGALESVLQTFAAPEQVKQLFIWNMGSLQQLSAKQVPWLSILVGIGIIGSLLIVKALNALVIGESQARQLGIPVNVVRFFILLLTALLAGSITAFCGPIAFVGLAVPNLSRALLKTQDHLALILCSVLIGALFLLLVDSLILVLDPWISLPVNVLTAVLGAPYVAYLMLRRQ